MCGFIGILGQSAATLQRDEIGTLRHRGPDSSATFYDPNDGISLAFARLAIMDLSNAATQPMTNDSKSVVMVFNGEIYNFKALKNQLKGYGFAFRTTSDSEVLLKAYEHWGESVVDHLRGMFAFAIWDKRTKTLFAARDHLGVKPFFYCQNGKDFKFASEIKAILQMGTAAKLNVQAVSAFLRYLYVPRPSTIFQGIFELEPGHVLLVRGGEISKRRYWVPPSAATAPRLTTSDLAEQLRSLLHETVELQMASDVPLGAYLSGGIDSSSIVAIMARASSRPVKTFCMTFGPDEGLYDERRYAQIVAKQFGTDHTEIPVHPDLVETLPRVVSHFDEPFGNPTALLSFLLAEQTRKFVTVSLAGDGGDELFLGYPRYRGATLAEKYRWLPLPARKLLAEKIAPHLRDSTIGKHGFRRVREFLQEGAKPLERMYANWVGYFDSEEIAEILTPSLRPQSSPDDFMLSLLATNRSEHFVDAVNRTDLDSFLPSNLLHYTDRMSMAHSLEVRVPFCDHVLAEFALSLPASSKLGFRESKTILRQAMAPLLPSEILNRPKLGFNPPMGIWLNRDLQGLADQKLDPDRLRKQGIFNPEPITRMREAHAQQKRDYSLHIWALLVFQTWLELYNPSF